MLLFSGTRKYRFRSCRPPTIILAVPPRFRPDSFAVEEADDAPKAPDCVCTSMFERHWRTLAAIVIVGNPIFNVLKGLLGPDG